jgi:hypothetical protein
MYIPENITLSEQLKKNKLHIELFDYVYNYHRIITISMIYRIDYFDVVLRD